MPKVCMNSVSDILLTFDVGKDGINVGHAVNRCADIRLVSSLICTDSITIVFAIGKPSPRVL